jgi:hypothetical protein
LSRGFPAGITTSEAEREGADRLGRAGHHSGAAPAVVTGRAAEIRCSRSGCRFTSAMPHGAVSASESAPADLTA